MPDRAYIIVRTLELKIAIAENNDLNTLNVTLDVLKEILALLKGQEAVEPFHKCIGKAFSLIEDSHFDYCPYCGKPITWAKQEGR